MFFGQHNGLLSPDDYLESTSKLQAEIAALRPLDYDRLEEAIDLITYFKSYWDQCAEFGRPEEARQQLMNKIIDRVFLFNDKVIAVALLPDFGVVLDVPDSSPDQILKAVNGKEKGYNPSELYPERERRVRVTRWVYSVVTA